jgi:hypothetical protein
VIVLSFRTRFMALRRGALLVMRRLEASRSQPLGDFVVDGAVSALLARPRS